MDINLRASSDPGTSGRASEVTAFLMWIALTAGLAVLAWPRF